MTDDKIRITRRIALEKMYEYYEVEYTTTLENFEDAVFEVEACVQIVRNQMGEPTPEISPKSEAIEQGDVFADLQRAGVADLVILKGDVATLTGWVDEDMFKKIHGILKTAGFERVSAGKDSRWER